MRSLPIPFYTFPPRVSSRKDSNLVLALQPKRGHIPLSQFGGTGVDLESSHVGLTGPALQQRLDDGCPITSSKLKDLPHEELNV